MAYYVTELITRAYYLSGVTARRLQTVTGDQISDGLFLLNALLAVKSFDEQLIPYFTKTTISTVAGQETYFVDRLLEIETQTFDLQTNVRMPMTRLGRTEYFNTARVNNLRTILGAWHLEREKGGARIYLYPLPDQIYPLTFVGKYGFLQVELIDDLEEVYDDYYIEYLRYALAEYICADYGIILQPQVEKKLNEYEDKLKYVSPIDFSTIIRQFAQKKTGDIYAQANLGRGWVP